MVEIRRLDPSDAGDIGRFLQIYQASIEPSEQKPASQMTALAGDSRYHVVVSCERGEITGFAMSFVPRHAHFVLLEYMAVDTSLRSRGTGTALLDAASGFAESRNVPLLLEVDQPGSAPSPGNDPVRRLRFYGERNCRRIVGLDYILPLEAEGKPPPMWLLVRGAKAAVSRHELREWLSALYVEVYAQGADDPRIDAMLSGSDQLEFGLSPIP